MPRTRKPKPTDIPEEVLHHVAGPARPLSPADVDAIMRQFNKAIVERLLHRSASARRPRCKRASSI